MRVIRTMPHASWIVALACVAPLIAFATRAAADPNEPLVTEQRPSSPLVIATDQPPPPPPPPPPARAVAVPEAPYKMVLAGGVGVTFLAPLVTGAKAGGTSFTWVGASLLSYNGEVWFVPQTHRSGFAARAGGRFSFAEAMPVGVYSADLNGAAGYRWHLNGNHHAALLGGMQGSGGLAMQHQFAIFRFPEAEAAWQWHEDELFVSLAPLAGLSMVGRYAFGKKLVVSEEEKSEKDALSSSHSFKPYLGAHATVAIRHAMADVAVRRTYLGSSQPGGPLDHLIGQLCYASTEKSHETPWGGCIVGDLLRGEVERIAPVEGPVRDAWSYRIGLNLMFSYVFVDKRLGN